MTIQIFLPNVLRMILCPACVRKNMITQISRKKFIATVNKYSPKKIKTFRGNQKQSKQNSKTKQTKLETQQIF